MKLQGFSDLEWQGRLGAAGEPTRI
uniref:Uncharacterized protein n=1 Tax=Tetraselmis sp. GSL018 TaxID=582737 RepID=A0A061RT48_9CHLO